MKPIGILAWPALILVAVLWGCIATVLLAAVAAGLLVGLLLTVAGFAAAAITRWARVRIGWGRR